MRALVINLARSRERMHFQSSQLEGLGIEFERLEAIDAKQLDRETYEKNAYYWERPLRDTEVACCLSHATAWKHVQQLKEPCLILEDDALLCSQTKEILEALEKQTQYDCISLETRGRKKVVSKEKEPLTDVFKISKLIQDKSGAAAYVLFPSGAEILLEKLRTQGAGLADALITTTYHWKHGQIEPAAAIQLDCCHLYGIECPLETQTHIHHKDKPKAKDPLRFYWRRFVSQLSIAFRKLSFLKTTESIQIKPYHIKNFEARKTIALVINDLKGNGAERVVITLASGFRKSGHQAHIVCFKRVIELAIPETVPVHIFSAKRFRWIPRAIRGIIIAPWFDYFVKQKIGTPDLVLSNLMPSDRLLAHSKLPNVHFVIHSNTRDEISKYFPEKKQSELAIRKKLYSKKPCVCVSQGVENDLRLLLERDSNKPITTIYNPVDVKQITQAAEESVDDIVPNAILHVGKFNVAKRQDRLIRAYAAIDCNYPLVFLGIGPLLQKTKDLVAELGLNDRIHFLGFRKNSYPYIKAARLLVLCSDFEGLGMVLLEALVLKTAAISTDCKSGPNEILHPKSLCKIGAPKAFEVLLDNSSKHPELYKFQLNDKFMLEHAQTGYLGLLENPNLNKTNGHICN